MALEFVNENVEFETISGVAGHSLYDLDDIRRLSIYATLRLDDLKELKNQQFGVSSLEKKVVGEGDTRRVSLQELFTQPKHLQQCSADETIHEEEPYTESTETDLVVQDEYAIQYTVKGIRKHEFPVKAATENSKTSGGFYLDGRICPGFKYHARYLGTDKEVFGGKARVLQSVGMGYGKRLTFKGEKLNLNDCFFWTDNNTEGYGFSISVISKGDKFMIYDSFNQRTVDVTVESVDEPHIEESMTCANGNITKRVRVRFTCSIRFHNRLEHTVYDIAVQDLQTVEGTAEVVKTRKSKEAKIVCIKDVEFAKIGTCTLWNERL